MSTNTNNVYLGIDWTFYYEPTEYHAYKLSIMSCLTTLFAGLIGLACFAASSSPSMLGYSFENLVDLFSSVVVVWRFYIGEGSAATITEEKRMGMDRKEKRASILIAMILFILGVVVASVAIAHLAESETVTDRGLLIGVSVPSFLIFGGLAVVKWRMSTVLQSPAFKKDAMCSAFGATLSFGVFLSSAVGSNSLDAFVAIFVAMICMWVGLRTLVKNVDEGHNEWWTMQFWRDEGETQEEVRAKGGGLSLQGAKHEKRSTRIEARQVLLRSRGASLLRPVE